MGPMGPMGQGMQGMTSWAGVWGAAMMALGPLLVIVLLLGAAAVTAAVLWRGVSEGGRPAHRAPEETLRHRYARGEIGWQEFREGLMSLLKARYVRGQLTLEEYETRLEHLLDDSVGLAAAAIQPPCPTSDQAVPTATGSDCRAAARANTEAGGEHG